MLEKSLNSLVDRTLSLKFVAREIFIQGNVFMRTIVKMVRGFRKLKFNVPVGPRTLPAKPRVAVSYLSPQWNVHSLRFREVSAEFWRTPWYLLVVLSNYKFASMVSLRSRTGLNKWDHFLGSTVKLRSSVFVIWYCGGNPSLMDMHTLPKMHLVWFPTTNIEHCRKWTYRKRMNLPTSTTHQFSLIINFTTTKTLTLPHSGSWWFLFTHYFTLSTMLCLMSTGGPTH